MSRFLAVLIVLCFMSCNNKEVKIKKMPTKIEKVVIAHRGASGYLPEHTLPAKAMAYGMNVDFIEQLIESISTYTKKNLNINIILQQLNNKNLYVRFKNKKVFLKKYNRYD